MQWRLLHSIMPDASKAFENSLKALDITFHDAHVASEVH